MLPRRCEDGDLNPAVRVDAVVAPAELSLELADELARLEPFGLGNPDVTLLCPGRRGPRRRGDGRGAPPADVGRAGRVPLPRRRVRAGSDAGRDAAGRSGGRGIPPPSQRVEWHRDAADGAAGGAAAGRSRCRCPVCPPSRRSRPGPAIAMPARAASRWRRLLGCWPAAPIAPLLSPTARDVSRRSPAPCGPTGSAPRRLALLEYGDPLAERFGELVALDPPADPEQAAWLDACSERSTVHLVWGPSEVDVRAGSRT